MIPVLDIPHAPPPGFAVREATLADVGDLTRLWYSSFNPSHKFWDTVTPRDVATRQWWDAAWTLGIEAGPAVLRTFVVEDLSRGGRLVAFARWNVPQADGSQDIPLPDYPAEWDPELTEALWGGMPKNRASIMDRRPHWSVDKDYQKNGLGFTLVDWGCRQADSLGLEVYLDATLQGLPFYKRYFGFQEVKALKIPSRPDLFGTYELMASVRPAKTGHFLKRDGKPRVKASDCGVVEVVEVQLAE